MQAQNNLLLNMILSKLNDVQKQQRVEEVHHKRDDHLLSNSHLDKNEA